MSWDLERPCTAHLGTEWTQQMSQVHAVLGTQHNGQNQIANTALKEEHDQCARLRKFTNVMSRRG